MKRTAFPIKDRRTVGYVYGGTKVQRMVEYALLKEQHGCYMCLASPRKNKEVIDFIRNKHSENGIIISLGKNGRVFEWVV